MMDPMQFSQRLEEYTKEIVDSPKALGSDKIFYPGEPNWITYDKAVNEGLELPEDTEKAAIILAEMAGLDSIYYKKICKAISAEKFFKILNIEDRMHRKMLQNYNKPRQRDRKTRP